MSYKTGFICLLIISASLSGCADSACEKIIEIDNELNEWDDAFLYIASRGAAATGHYEIVGLIEIVEGVKTVCAVKHCIEANADSCVTLLADFSEDPKEQMLIGIAWHLYQEGDQIESDDLVESKEMDWGNWTSNNYAMF